MDENHSLLFNSLILGGSYSYNVEVTFSSKPLFSHGITGIAALTNVKTLFCVNNIA